jgi:hypothetical protein
MSSEVPVKVPKAPSGVLDELAADITPVVDTGCVAGKLLTETGMVLWSEAMTTGILLALVFEPTVGAELPSHD